MRTIVWDVDDVLNDLMYQWFSRGWQAGAPDCDVGLQQTELRILRMFPGSDRSEDIWLPWMISEDGAGIAIWHRMRRC